MVDFTIFGQFPILIRRGEAPIQFQFRAFEDGEYEALVLYETGDISLINQGVEMFIDEPFFAIGSGKEFCMGALAAGASLPQAMRIAARFDTMTGYDSICTEFSHADL